MIAAAPRPRRLLAAAGALAIAACSLAAPLDYLQEDVGKPLPEGGGVETGPGAEAGTKTATPVVEGQAQPRLLHQDGANLYWAVGESMTAAIVAVPKTGGAPRQVVTLPAGQRVKAFTMDDGFIYFAAGKQVTKIAKNAAPGEMGTAIYTAPQPVTDVLADGDSVFVGYSDAAEENLGFGRVPKAGGPFVLVDDIASLYRPYAFAVDATHVYYTSDVITRSPKGFALPDGGTAVGESLGDNANDELIPIEDIGIRIDNNVIFWTQVNGALATIEGVFRHGTTPGGKPLSLFDRAASGISVDERHVYFTVPNDGEVRRVLKEGGEGELLLAGQTKPTEVLVDGPTVYVVLAGKALADGAIVKFTK